MPSLKATEVAVVLIRPAQGRIENNSSPLIENARVEWQNAKQRPPQVDVDCGVGLTRVSIEPATYCTSGGAVPATSRLILIWVKAQTHPL